MVRKLIKEKCDLLLKIFISGGVFGFIYEEIFYLVDLGYLTKRGSTFGPWIPIYAFGAVLIYLLCYKIRKRPFLIFILALIISGILEFVVGYLLFHLGGIRLWDYSNEILNFGNIGGYVCFRSVIFFGISGLILFFLLVPFLEWVNKKCNNKINFYITRVLFGLFLVDMAVSWTIMWLL